MPGDSEALTPATTALPTTMAPRATTALPVGRRRVVSPVLIGRDRELEWLTQAAGQPPAVLVVEGEAGVGKTRLTSELLRHAESAGLRVLAGGCRPIREPFPLGPMIEAVQRLGEDLVAAPLSPVVGALRPLLPELAHVLPPRPEPLEDRLAERHRVFRGFGEVLGTLGPAVLVLEDLHWADEQTIDLLRFLVGSPQPGLVVALTYRGEEAAPEVRGLTARLPASVGLAHVTLNALDPVRVNELAAAILGVDRISREFAIYLCERSSGLPFAVEELLALLRTRGTLAPRHGGGWARKALDELGVPTGIRDSVLERVSQLSDAARQVVQVAATLQTPAPVSVLVATGQSSQADALTGLDEALQSGLLTEDAGRVGFRHVLAAQATYESIALPHRLLLHSRAASAWEQADPVPLGQVAHHLRRAGRHQEWVAAAERAADLAIELGNADEAANLLEDVVRDAPMPTDARGRIAVTLGRAAMEAGRSAEMIPLLSDIIEQELPTTVRGELRFWLAMLMYQLGSDHRQYQLFTQAVDELAERPGLRAWAMVNLGLPMHPQVRLSEHLGWLRKAQAAMVDVHDRALEVLLLGKIAMVLAAVGDPQWRRLTERILHLTGGVPQGRLAVSAFRDIGSDACLAGHHDISARLLSAGLEGAASCGSDLPGLRLRASQALLDYCVGSWRQLQSELPPLLDPLLRDAPSRLEALLSAGCLAVARGDFDTARERLTTVLRTSDSEGGTVDLLPLLTTAMVRLSLAEADVDGAVAWVDRLMTELEVKPVWPPMARALPVAIEAMTAANRTGEARDLLDRFADAVRDLDAPLAPAALRDARGHLDAGAARWAEAADHFWAAAERYQPLQCPYEAAQAREHAARCLLHVDLARAGETLRSALATYQDLGALWDLDRAMRLAREHGVTMPARHRGGTRGYGPQMSPREREVAQLAATGRSNQQIADQLFVSVSTVKKHLAAAMRKLGVRSRTALARRVIDGPGSDGSYGSPGP